MVQLSAAKGLAMSQLWKLLQPNNIKMYHLLKPRSMSVDELKEQVLKWAGLPIEGETKDALKTAIKDRLWQLQCDLDRQANTFYKDVDNLNIPNE